MVIVTTGSRNWTNKEVIEAALYNNAIGYDGFNYKKTVTVIQGGCPTGADKIVRDICRVWAIKCVTMEADWKKYGKSAGPRRNTAMLNRQPNLVIGFCRNLSKGTMDCLKKAKARGMEWELHVEK